MKCADFFLDLYTLQPKSKEENKKIENYIAKLQMAVRLYHLKLNIHLVRIEKCFEDFYDGRQPRTERNGRLI
ncbi:hypothetical protein SAMN05421863_102540 [Nitrosomonas communis]|uniref:Uncharacterized protein n=1 Tax=Nitrosomonas communis TaxID=44574 RepID=A0A1I4Q961_9PROT|nr:hypothetical protein SAMN05421863_102540 [Nitrosomonas communis]